MIYIRSLKQALSHGLVLKKMHRIIKFNQKASLKSYIDMNTELKKIAKNDFVKDFFMLLNCILQKQTMEKCEKKHGNIKLVTTKAR